MDSTWNDAIQSLFQVEAFVQKCYIEGFETKCFCTSISDNLVFTEAGLQSDCNFILDVKIDKLDRIPKEGDKVVFRSKTFKIASTEIDSAGVCMKLYLIALSKGA